MAVLSYIPKYISNIPTKIKIIGGAIGAGFETIDRAARDIYEDAKIRALSMAYDALVTTKSIRCNKAAPALATIIGLGVLMGLPILLLL
jgi:hypothetical protein